MGSGAPQNTSPNLGSPSDGSTFKVRHGETRRQRPRGRLSLLTVERGRTGIRQCNCPASGLPRPATRGGRSDRTVLGIRNDDVRAALWNIIPSWCSGSSRHIRHRRS